jgi:hypothetical protein
VTISRQTIQAAVAGTAVEVTDASVSLDETRAPYAVADFTVPYTEDAADLLDPRTGPRVHLTMQQAFMGAGTLADLTAAAAPGGTIADLSARWSGMNLGDITETLATPWNSVAPTTSTDTRRLNLTIRSRDVNHRDATIRVRATSDEAILTAYALMRDAPVMPDSYDVADAVRLVLRTVIPGAVLVVDGVTGDVEPEAAVWNPGKGAWDYLSPLIASHGLRLWCDENRTFYLGDPTTATWPSQRAVALSTEDAIAPWLINTIDASDGVDLDSGLWFDGCVVTYRWTPWTEAGTGTPQIAHDVAGPSNATSVLAIDRSDTPYPGPGEAAARLSKVEQLGRVITGTRVSDFMTGPRALASFHTSATNNLTGYVTSVQWSFPEGTCTLRPRDMS